jgi:hypothetical protein
VDIIHRNETHNTWYLTRPKTTVKWKSSTYDVTVADMNGLNRYLYVYNAPSIGMEEEVFHTWTDDDKLLWWTFDTAPDECIELACYSTESQIKWELFMFLDKMFEEFEEE